ncbi:glycosyltransferase family 4 protein [Hyphomicrobium sp.]|uniref:glycosyltransferase family 4 protein n=1 Tax=Hyphomicrobium sp. TaxID=82 RepID=UPI0025B84137|nr:glycosyltransferase family 4 protein [Hyphomicrobium sp.]MCC7250782.1 glycosyltransferase family 4 protein [Hyphomicrobium sp.]
MLDIRHLLFDTCASHDLSANGVFVVARQLAAEQRAAGETAKVMLLRGPERKVPDDPAGLVESVLLEGPKVRGHRIAIAGRVLDTITAPGTGRTFVHIHSGREPLLLPLMLRLRKRGIPYAITVHGRYSHLFDASGAPTRRLPTLYLQHVERHVLESAEFVQALTTAERDIIRSIAPRARIVLLTNAAYSSRFDGEPRGLDRPAVSAGVPTFGFIGRYEIEHKGLDLLLDGFASYRNDGGKGELALVGSGPARETISSMAEKLDIAAHVSVSGPLFGDDKARTLAEWDYFVAPSRFEGAPISALQAAFAGLPLIVSEHTGLRDQVAGAEAGFTLDTLDAGAIANAMHAAERSTSEQWQAMSAAARRMAMSVGDWTVVAAKLASLYRGA